MFPAAIGNHGRLQGRTSTGGLFWFTEDFIGHLSYLLSQEVVNHTQILHLEFRNQGLLVTTTLSE
jgi:hypothetical protein